jgi:UDP-N-acetylmuramate dehydrogenase
LVARKLIEECGLAGVKVGGAQVSELHTNFIVNISNAKSADVLALIKLCKEKVKEKFKIDLEEEIVVI